MPYVGREANSFTTVVDVTVSDDLTVTDDATIGGALSAKGGAVFNEDSADVDFRVESNGNANALFVDGGQDAVGIGTSSLSSFNANRNNLVVSGPSVSGITINSTATDGSSIISMTDGTGTLAGEIHYVHDGDYMQFKTANTERLRIESGGDIDVGTGDIYFSTAGKGIVLGATSNTAANTLEDYEEGTFTVAFGDGHSGSITIDNNYKTGVYTKIGNAVTFTVHVRASAISSPGGNLDLSGLPFATPNNTDYRHTVGPCIFFAFTGMTDGDYPVAWINQNSSKILFALTNTNNIQNFPANRITATSEFYVTGVYQV